MSAKPYTDVPVSDIRDIVVVQPGSTFSVDPIWIATSDEWSRAFYDVSDWLNVRHVGTLTLSQHADGPDHLCHCSGQIEVRDERTSDFCKRSQRDFILTCTNCAMSLVTDQYMLYREFRGIVLHLMLKQMVPDLACCNFVDCSGVQPGLVLIKQKADMMRQLGFLSVYAGLWGKLNNPDSIPDHTKHYGLGFMLMPNMHIRQEGCGAWSQWLQLLVHQKFLTLKELGDNLRPELLGPKPARRS